MVILGVAAPYARSVSLDEGTLNSEKVSIDGITGESWQVAGAPAVKAMVGRVVESVAKSGSAVTVAIGDSVGREAAVAAGNGVFVPGAAALVVQEERSKAVRLTRTISIFTRAPDRFIGEVLFVEK
jgi:hypothetical protein